MSYPFLVFDFIRVHTIIDNLTQTKRLAHKIGPIMNVIMAIESEFRGK